MQGNGCPEGGHVSAPGPMPSRGWGGDLILVKWSVGQQGAWLGPTLPLQPNVSGPPGHSLSYGNGRLLQRKKVSIHAGA